MTSTTKHAAETASTQRNRRWWRWPLRMFLVGFIAFACWLGSWVYWAYTVVPNPTVDYAAKIEQLARDAQPEGENGWPLITQALQNFADLETAFPRDDRPGHLAPDHLALLIYDDVDVSELLRDLYLEADQVEAIEAAHQMIAWLEGHEVHELLMRVGRTPNAVRHVEVSIDQPLTGFMLQDVTDLRALGKVLTANMVAAIESGEVTRASAALDGTLCAASACTWQGTLVTHLVGLAMIDLITRELVESVLESNLSSDEIGALLAILRERINLAPAALSIRGERCIAYDMIQRTYSDEGRGDGYLILTALDPFSYSRISNLQVILSPTRREVVEDIDNLYERLIEHSNLPHTEYMAAQQMSSVAINPTGPGLAMHHAMIRALQNSLYNIRMIDFKLRGRETVLAVEMFRAANGRLPSSLDELVPAYMDSVPGDLVDGESLHYVIDDSVSPHEYNLYSVGVDGVDNNGMYPVGNPEAAVLRKHVDGTDYVYSRTSE